MIVIFHLVVEMTAVILHFVKVQTLVRVFVVILKLTESGAFTKSGSITAIATSFNNLSNLEIPAKSSRANLGVRGYRVNKFKKLRLNNFRNNQNEQAKRKDKMRKKEEREKGKRIRDNQSLEFAAGRFSIQA